MTTVQRPATSPHPKRGQSSSNTASYDDELRSFMRSTEVGARKLLKTAAKKEMDTINRDKARRNLELKAGKPLNDLTNRKMAFDVTGPEHPPDNSGVTMSTADTAVIAYGNLPKHTKRAARGGTVTLQSLPGGDNAKTQISDFAATRALKATSAVTLRQTPAGRTVESVGTSAMLRKSTAFDPEPKRGNKGIDSMTGGNAIPTGLGGVTSDGFTTNPGTMNTTYEAKRFDGTNTVLEMGRFGAKMNHVPPGRNDNNRGAITTASRAKLLKQQAATRPHTVGSSSPARGAPIRGAAKIAMARMDSTLRVASSGNTRSQSAKKIHNSLDNHVYNKKTADGLVSSDASKSYFKIKKEKKAWQSQEAPDYEETVRRTKGQASLEAGNAVSWSADDIRIKWRGENEREEAWKVSRASVIAAKEMQNAQAGAAGTNGWVVPTVHMDRHPMHELYWKYVKKENVLATKRAEMRAKTRRFALDVHTVWLTNLSHLREHSQALGAPAEPNPERARGLDGARDVDNIQVARSQIQSVSADRSLRVMDGFKFNEENRTWEADFATTPPPAPELSERPIQPPTLTALVENEPTAVPGCSGEILVSIHRFETKRRSYYETAALLVNGRWEIPKSGGAEKLEPGFSVNRDDDIVKLSPKKFQAKNNEQNGFFSEGFDEQTPHREGETLESMEHLDGWCASNGKAFEDVAANTQWRISFFDQHNGEFKTVVLDEKLVLMHHKEHARKQKLKYDVTRSTRPVAPIITHRQGARLHCKDKHFATLFSVSIMPGDGQDKNVYVDITATVKVTKKKKELEKDARTIYKLTKRINTIECRERLHMSSFAPARDVEWWRDPARAANVWRPLLERMILLPEAPPADDGNEETPLKKKRKGKKSAAKTTIVPGELTFPTSESDSIYETIGIAFELLPLIRAQSDANAASPPAVEDTRFPTILPTAWEHGAKIRVEGISDSVHKDDEGGTGWGNDRFVDWEYAAEYSPDSESLLLTGDDKYKEMVPGVTECGKLEPFDYLGYNNFPPGFTGNRTDKLRTQAALVLSRDPNTSSTNSIQARHILVLEKPVYAPLNLYWELSEREMPMAPHETIQCIIPQNMHFPTSLYENGLDSMLNARIGPVCYILSGSEVPLDYGGIKELLIDEKYDREEVVTGYNDLGFEIKETKLLLKPRNKNRRRMTQIDEHGFRQNLLVLGEIIRPIAEISPAIFGITAKGASANQTSMGSRTIWHSEQRCVEVLCRLRTPFDYLSVIKAKCGSGFSDPKGYTMLLKGYSLDEMVGVGSIVFGKVYERLDAKHGRSTKMQGLSDKIAQAEENLKRNRTSLEREIRMTSQKAVVVKAKFGDIEGKQPEAMSRDAWLVRYEMSNLIDVRAGWEKREIMDGGAVFYYKNLVGVGGGEIECSFDIPDDYENWEASEIKPGMMVGDEEDGEDGLRDGETQADVDRKNEEKKVNQLARMIANDEVLLKTLANKLGILISRDKGEGLDLNMRKQRGRDAGVLRRELADEDNDWSDDDFEIGDEGDDRGELTGSALAGEQLLPQDNGDVAKRRREEYVEGLGDGIGVKEVPGNVPKLKLNPDLSEGIGDDASAACLEKHVQGKGWRRLNRATVAPNFLEKITKAKPLLNGGDEVGNTINKMRMPVMVDPCKVCEVKEMTFPHQMESLFIKDVMGDQLRNIEGTRMRKEREEELMAGGGMEAIIENQPNALTIADMTTGGVASSSAPPGEDDDPEHLAAKAIEASRTGNIQELEFILELNKIEIDSKDNFGNSLLHLACQQGNKRMVKFLLRRGADIKTQNAAGNSVLHHCHAYSHQELAEYLLSKGADDSLVNVEGCTCYEGLKKDEVNDI